MAGSDRRVHARQRAELDAIVLLADERIHARLRDVSRGGLCLEVGVWVATGREVTIELLLPPPAGATSKLVSLAARVAWSTSVGPGRHQLGLALRSTMDVSGVEALLAHVAALTAGDGEEAGRSGDLFEAGVAPRSALHGSVRIRKHCIFQWEEGGGLGPGRRYELAAHQCSDCIAEARRLHPEAQFIVTPVDDFGDLGPDEPTKPGGPPTPAPDASWAVPPLTSVRRDPSS